jgi:protein arginine kinase activator
MICSQCKQRTAKYHVTRVVNGEKTEKHLCDECAVESGENFQLYGVNSFPIEKLLSGMMQLQTQSVGRGKSSSTPSTTITCSKCGMTLQQFHQHGKFGCVECVLLFQDRISPLIRKVHGGHVSHLGKVPKKHVDKNQFKKQIQHLKRELVHAIQEEKFEEAARIRDHLRQLDQEQPPLGKGGTT